MCNITVIIYPPHLLTVPTLPWEILMSENSDNLKIYSDNNKSQGSVATHLWFGGFA